MKSVQIFSPIWYAPDYHLFFSCPGDEEVAEGDLEKYIASHRVCTVASRAAQGNGQDNSVLPPEAALQRHLKTVTVELTSACNLACPYCYLFGSGRLGDQQSCPSSHRASAGGVLQRIVRIVEETCQPELTIQFIGGEPLLNFPTLKVLLVEIRRLAQLHSKKVHLQIVTNGTLLTKTVWEVLDDYGVEVLLSLDGPAAIQDFLRPLRSGGRTCDLILNNVCGHESETSILFMLCKQTKALTENIKWFLDQGFKAVSFNYVYTADPAVALTRQDLDDILADIDANRDFYAVNFERIRNFRRFAESFPISKPRLCACNAGRNYAALGADGNYYLCQRGFGIESLRLDRMRDAGSPHKLQSVLEDRYCSQCWAKHICGGLCWFNPLFWASDYRELRCRFTRELIKRVARTTFRDRQNAILQESSVELC